MTYYLTLDNVFGKKHGLNLSQLYLCSFIVNLHSWADKITIGGNIFYKCTKGLVIRELPMLTEKEDTVYRLFKQLEEKGLIELKKIDGIDYLQMRNPFSEWARGSEINPSVGLEPIDSEKNPNRLGKKSEKHSEKNPTDNNTIYDNNTIEKNNNENLAKKNEPEKKTKPPLQVLKSFWLDNIPEYKSVWNDRDDMPALRELCEKICKKPAQSCLEDEIKTAFRPFLDALKKTYLIQNPIKTINNNYQKVLMEQQKIALESPKNKKIDWDKVNGRAYPESRGVRLNLK